MIKSIWDDWKLMDAVEAGPDARKLLRDLAAERLSLKEAAERAQSVLNRCGEAA